MLADGLLAYHLVRHSRRITSLLSPVISVVNSCRNRPASLLRRINAIGMKCRSNVLATLSKMASRRAGMISLKRTPDDLRSQQPKRKFWGHSTNRQQKYIFTLSVRHIQVGVPVYVHMKKPFLFLYPLAKVFFNGLLIFVRQSTLHKHTRNSLHTKLAYKHMFEPNNADIRAQEYCYTFLEL